MRTAHRLVALLSLAALGCTASSVSITPVGDDVPADLAINYHFGAIHRLGMWYHADGELSGEQVGKHFADLMLRSLRP